MKKVLLLGILVVCLSFGMNVSADTAIEEVGTFDLGPHHN
ncbi:hypothetical protein A33I_18255 [Alkalihalophilus marmarensis DSM 21297]|uniref:Uncharacterized protein n=1 Tax=Alkalihalophilus marmarensis DSM 21297 TaxID=1188261 RepID=U6SN31_9BACI|nr:hypothetical protein A33I_18255 [Alkalihalophilus marmarensis DSM 21297]